MKVICNGTVIAESDNTVVVERNHYFPKKAANEIKDRVAFRKGIRVEE
ncbi:hypothetical protein GCM10023187_02520 [Nibrella viscosa]|uniref:DUF427 domain-containing protein n=1 Tax=Nibrella viscosa TaxID=1084524 RepID=A0ABP8JSK3_9BACT